MIKTNYTSVNLTCVMQEVELTTDKCPTGVISINPADGSFRFEEGVKKPRPARNTKLFDGNYCSLVHMQNGRYQIHMKTINASGSFDRQDLAFKVYSELLTAFNVID